MTKEKLCTKSVRIARRLESQRNARRRRNNRSARYNNDTAARNVDVRNLRNRRAYVNAIKVLLALIVQSSTEPRTNSPPTGRINLGAYEKLNRIIWKRIRRMAAHILRGTKLTDTLEPT